MAKKKQKQKSEIDKLVYAKYPIKPGEYSCARYKQNRDGLRYFYRQRLLQNGTQEKNKTQESEEN